MTDRRLLAARDAGLRGQHQQAVDLCIAVLQERPGNSEACAYLGLSLWRAAAYPQAVEVILEALRHWPNQPELNLALLDSWRALGEEDVALRFAAALPADLLAGPLFRTWRAALSQGAAELGPGLGVEDRLARMYDQGLLDEFERELIPQIQTHPRWAKGRVFHALLSFSRRGSAVTEAMLRWPENTSITNVDSVWRKELAAALSAYRDKVVAQILEAQGERPEDSQARMLLAHVRFENGVDFSKGEVDAMALQIQTPLLGPIPLRTAREPSATALTVKLLESATVIHIPEPRSFGAGFELTGAVGPALTSARYVAVATSAKVAAGSDVVLLSDGSAVCDPLTHALGELVNYVSDSWIVLGSTKQVLLRDLPITQVDGPAISLLGASARFYGHWLLDHLLRLRSVLEHPLASQACVLVEDKMPASHYESLQWLLGHDVVIRRVAPGHCVQTDCLLFAGPDVFFPHLTRRYLPAAPSVAPSSIGGMAFLRERMLASLGAQRRQGRRFVVRRTSGTRQVQNEAAVCDMLVNHWGFEELFPEALSFAVQVRHFHDADVIVGVQGSALSNCVFCAPGACVIALCSSFAANFPSWAYALESSGIHHCFVVGEAAQDSHFLAIQRDFHIDLEALRSALISLGVSHRPHELAAS
mgnify:CR=1 FL=1